MTGMADTPLVTFERSGAIAEIRLNRPDKLNAISAEMLDDLHRCLDQAEQDGKTRALLLSGEGRAFSAGFDLEPGPRSEGVSEAEHTRRELQRAFDLILRIWDFPKPVVAAVHGYCLGSSFEIAAVCDLTVASEDCRFGVPEVRFGSGIVCLVLPWLTGLKHANELLLLGGQIDAARAESMGLVNLVVPANELRLRAADLAREIGSNDAYAVAMTRRAIRRSFDIAGLRDALVEALEIDVTIETTETPESREFNRILAAEGPKAAIAWRAARTTGDQC